MSRLILIPQYPSKMRYQEWYIREFPLRLKKYFDDIIVLGENWQPKTKCSYSEDMFSPIKAAIDFENEQISQYMKIDLKKNDILLLNDISFPGLFPSVLYHKRPSKCFAICHGTSKNRYDYFEKDQHSKWQVEKGHMELFDNIFIATEYHKQKLKVQGTKIVALPKAPFETYKNKKSIDIISVSRPSIQKVDLYIEKKIEKIFATKIFRHRYETWAEYYQHISKSYVMIITSCEETFGYQVLDAVYNHCIPVAPNKLSYPELLPREYLYDNLNELVEIMSNIFHNCLPTPKILCQNQIDNFYDNIAKIMLGE